MGVPTSPLHSLVGTVRQVVFPADLALEVVHYSIPVLEATGEPALEASESIKSAKLLLSGGEVLISRLNPRKSRVVSVDDHPGIKVASTEFVALRPHSVDPRFLTYFLLSEDVRQELDAQVQSVTRSHQRVNPDAVLHLRVPQWPLEEQRRIADFLDAETARIDRLVNLTSAQRTLAYERRFAALSDLLTPSERGEPSKPAFPWLRKGEYPLVKLGHVARLQTGLTVDGSRGGGETFPYLRVANVQGSHLDLDDVKTISVSLTTASRSTLRVGDVLMTEGGDLDKLGRGTVWSGEIEQCLHQNHVFAVRPTTGVLLPQFLALMTQTHHARCYFESTGNKTTNLASTNSSKILAFRLPLPSLAVQQQLLKQQDQVDFEYARLRGALQRRESVLIELRQALITAAVTGSLDVTTARGAA